MTSLCRRIVLRLWFLALYCKVTTSEGMEISCINNERQVKFKQLDSDTGISTLIFALNGSTLICNCTRNTSSLFKDQHLSWTKNGQHRNQTSLNNETTVKITVPFVDWNSNKSSFACKASNLNQTIEHKQFLLIVGDRPGAPVNLEVDSFYQRPRFTWTAPIFTGSLQPVYYTVRLSSSSEDFPECTNFAAPCLGNEVSSQEEFLHVPGKKYSCVLPVYNYRSCIYDSLAYKVWVAANSEVGTTNSSNVLEIQSFRDFAYANSAIQAPEEINVKDITETGFKISFKKGRLWRVESYGDYYILYSTKLKLAVIGNDGVQQIVKYNNISLEDHIWVKDLTPWTQYQVCLQVQIVSKLYHQSTAFSPPKCSVVRTKQARPSVPPTITGCNSAVSSNNSMVFKNISWTVPPIHTLNSQWLEGFRLIFLKRDEVPEAQKQHVVIMDNSSTSYELLVPSFATVDVWIELCNSAGLCSDRSHKCRMLPSVLVKEAMPVFNDKRDLIIATVILFIVFLVSIIAAILCFRRRKASNRLMDMNVEALVNPYDTVTERPQLENPYD